MSCDLPSWVHEASCLPLAFAQVREDPLIDRLIVDRLNQDASVMMVASGGCTAAFLATAPKLAHLHLVDNNPAQLALTRLKLALLQTTRSEWRLALMGHVSMPVDQRGRVLTGYLSELGLSMDVMGPSDLIARLGPDQTGRYEFLFAELRKELSAEAGNLEALLRLTDPIEQQCRIDSSTRLGGALDKALDKVFALPHLIKLFGEQATKNPVEPFSRHFARRIRTILATQPAQDNPYLWQMLKGCYSPTCVSSWFYEAVPERMPRITTSLSPMAEALAAAPDSFDFVHLSNILDWLAPQEAQATLNLAWQALRPGGWVLVRQLNSSLDIPGLGQGFSWHIKDGHALEKRDRSFFYRQLHLGRKP